MFAEVFSYDQELIDKGIGIGMERGIEQGAHEKAVEMAKVMLGSKISLDDIIKFTGLSVDTIQSLAS